MVESTTYIAFIVAYTFARDLNFCGTSSYVELLLDELLLGDLLAIFEEVLFDVDDGGVCCHLFSGISSLSICSSKLISLFSSSCHVHLPSSLRRFYL